MSKYQQNTMWIKNKKTKILWGTCGVWGIMPKKIPKKKIPHRIERKKLSLNWNHHNMQIACSLCTEKYIIGIIDSILEIDSEMWISWKILGKFLEKVTRPSLLTERIGLFAGKSNNQMVLHHVIHCVALGIIIISFLIFGKVRKIRYYDP